MRWRRKAWPCFASWARRAGLADAMCNLAGARLSQNDYERAEPMLLEALALYRQLDVPTGGGHRVKPI